MTSHDGTHGRGGDICGDHEPRLSAYLLDELSPDERLETETHVSGCAACREELALLSQTADALRASPPVEGAIAPERREAILSAARDGAAAGPAPAGPRGYLYGLLGLAAAAAVVVSFVGVRMHQAGVDEKKAELLAMRVPPAAPASGPEAAVRAAVTASPPGASPVTEAAGKPAAPVEVERLGGRRLEELAAAPVDRILTTRLHEREREPRETAGVQVEEQLRRRLAVDGRPSAGTEEARKPDALALGGNVMELRTTLDAGLAQAPEESATDAYIAGLAPNEPESRSRQPGRGVTLVRDGVETKPRKRFLARTPQTPAPGVGESLESSLESEDKLYKELAKTVPEDPAGNRYLYEAAPAASPEAVVPATPPAPGGTAPAPGAAPAHGSGAGGGGAELVLTPAAAAPAPLADPLARGGEAAGLQPFTDRFVNGGETADGESKLGATTAAPAVDSKARVDEYLSRLDRKPGETPEMMFFRFWGDNPFVEAAIDRLSTFGVDVDTASYTVLRAYLYKRSILPPAAAVRTEEFVNYFRSRYAPPAADGPAFAIHADLAPSPFAHEPDYKLLKVGLKGREVAREKRKAAALVFVVDTSGSMRQENRLELVKDALRLLVRELDEGDSIGIVAFDREARVILEPCAASESERILSAIATLEPRQNTNVGAGLELGFRMAASRKLADGVNRVILLSDGVANTGVTDPDAILEMVRAQREQGIFLTCVGVGMGNMNDALLERLADRGNGQCVYVDRIEEARKAFVDNLTGTLEAIAKDVKIQVEFDPARVIRYRLLGYENRDIADASFRDNKVDAGEVGAGHEVAALYEVKLKPAAAPGDARAVAATIRVRYLTLEHGEAVELQREVRADEAKATFPDAPVRFQLSACAAELAEVLRESYWARGSALDRVAGMLEPLLSAPDGTGKLGDDADVVELVALLRKADALVREREARLGEVARTAEAMKENAWLRARIEDQLQIRRDTNRAQLDDILRQNDELRRRLEDLLRG